MLYSFNDIGSEEDFQSLLPYMGMAAILVMWPQSFEQTFVPKSQGFDFDWPSSFWAEDVWRVWTTTSGACLSYKLTADKGVDAQADLCLCCSHIV